MNVNMIQHMNLIRMDSNGNKIETFDTGIYNVGVFRKISNAA